MRPISSVDLFFLLKELKVLENQRIDTFYFNNGIFYLKVYISGKGNKFLTNKGSTYLYLGDTKTESLRPGGFVSYLRKHLKNGYIRQVIQVEAERLLQLVIEKKLGEEIKKFNLYFELFGTGNVVLCDENDKIMNLVSNNKFKDREIGVGKDYILPPKELINFSQLKDLNNKELEIKEKELLVIMKNSDLNLVKFLAISLGLGGKFAEEICLRANVDKNFIVAEADIEISKKIIENLVKILNSDTEAYGYYKNGEIIDYSPIKFNSIVQECEKFDNFNDVLTKYYKSGDGGDGIPNTEEILKKDSTLIKLHNRLDKQEKQLKDINVNYEKYNSIGNKIYENYALVEELLNSINKSAKDKGWDYVLSKIEETPELKKVVSKLNYKNNEIVLELD